MVEFSLPPLIDIYVGRMHALRVATRADKLESFPERVDATERPMVLQQKIYTLMGTETHGTLRLAEHGVRSSTLAESLETLFRHCVVKVIHIRDDPSCLLWLFNHTFAFEDYFGLARGVVE